ncbi:hypothetical protein PoB_003760400 [Plakobranchus ocellatus]|uniref:Uncharacterized protein n=1 Tax=Plakobranchus ocellatus TaxID=259542 RepID=A0AAV4AY93_9GAST|nr:hypothetical protein PoB_003760400 [Plakobranchus ocellatus]
MALLLSQISAPKHCGSDDGTAGRDSALRPAGNLPLRVLAPPPTPWPKGVPGRLRSPCCGLAVQKMKPSNHRIGIRIR